MKYDFENMINRKYQGSLKWNDMYSKKPDVGNNIVPLSVADMEFKNPPQITNGLKEYLDNTILGYTCANESFKDSVVNWMKKRHNFEIEKDWIVNTSGVVPAFFSAIREFTQEDNGVIIMTPVYYPFYNAIKLQNRKIVECPLIETDGYYTINYELFEELSKDKNNKVLLFCSPHNPVGRVWKKSELEKLEEIILRNDILLLSDEIHFDLIMPEYKHTVFQTLSNELSERTITFTAPSKTFNIAGMSMSNIIIKNENLRQRFINSLNEICAMPFSSLGYKSCELAYNECEEWLEECIKVIDTNQRIINSFFKEKYPQIKAPLIEGTYLQWVDFRALNLNFKELEEFMINEAQLFLDEGYIFGKIGEGFERFNIAVPSKVIVDSLERLDKALQVLLKK